MAISGITKQYCLIGDPVAHSLSPFIMNRAMRLAEIDGVYTAHQITESTLAETIAGMRASGLRGVNITYPLKGKVVAYLEKLSSRTSLLGAANTIDLSDGELAGHNTDAPGTALALEHFGSVELQDITAVIFGAGGAGRAAALGLLEAGAGEIIWLVRNKEKADAATARLRESWSERNCRTISLTDQSTGNNSAEVISRAYVLINATPVGMSGTGADNTLTELMVGLSTGQCCFDLVYHPRETAWLSAARSSGATCIEGLCLLVTQANLAFRCWTGKEFDLTDMYNAVVFHLENETGCEKE